MTLSSERWLGPSNSTTPITGKPLPLLQVMPEGPYISYPSDGFSVKVGAAIKSEGWRRRAIYVRLQLPDGEKLPFDGLETLLGDEMVYIMVVVRGKGVMLEDERGLFPSDTLLTQLRLLVQ